MKFFFCVSSVLILQASAQFKCVRPVKGGALPNRQTPQTSPNQQPTQKTPTNVPTIPTGGATAVPGTLKAPTVAQGAIFVQGSDAQGFRQKGQGIQNAEALANQNSAVPVKIQEFVATPGAARGDRTALQFRVSVPQASSSTPMGLNVLLHGDGAASFFDFPNARVDKDMPLIGVVVLAPTQSLTWGTGGAADNQANQRPQSLRHSQLVADLVQTTLPSMGINVDPNNVFFTGVSGGSLTLTQGFITQFGDKFPAGYMILCGGLVPPNNAAFPTAKIPSRVHFQTTKNELTGLQDRFTIPGAALALSKAVQSQQIANANTKFTIDGTPNGGHCAFDGKGFNSGIRAAVAKFTDIMRDSKPVAGITSATLSPLVGNENPFAK